MALSSVSLPVSSATASMSRRTNSQAPGLAGFYARWRSLRALHAVQRYDGLQARIAGMLRASRAGDQPSMGSILSAELTAWRTAVELRGHDHRQLADIEIPREMIGHVAALSAFGWPHQQGEAVQPGRIEPREPGLLGRARRIFFPTREELDDAYLAGSVDIYDLESRMAELDRRTERSGHI
jgi:hypothetical protein